MFQYFILFISLLNFNPLLTISSIINSFEKIDSKLFLKIAQLAPIENDISNQFENFRFYTDQILIWEDSLKLGILPDSATWPEEPLFSSIKSSFSALNIPKLVLNHPEVLFSVMIALIEMESEFSSRSQVHILSNPHVSVPKLL